MIPGRISPTKINTVYCADGILELESFPKESVDLILTDPPYGIDYQSNRRLVQPKFEEMQGDNPYTGYLDWLIAFVEQAYRVLKKDSHCYIFTRWDRYPLWYVEVRGNTSFQIKNCLIWVKNNHGSGDLKGSYSPKYEMVLLLSKGRRLLNGSRYADVMDFSKVYSPYLLHPTQKPIQLLSLLIEKSSQTGDLVIDPFCGSGSTCKAASLLSRKFIGIDIDPNQVRIAKKNLRFQE